ncbi:hypothetical protein NP493_1056g00004 [Ridgeia piscesae]|uniref:Biotin-protein ligase N-terminal domain-containing protein n=1 Tax=Ridgeia piscesae TaxID=27915 RepID=A0AAD9KI25_RIDPI|nr:hypothetical protein NP493_1056g00004 [Ridgeia piscesae]
MNSPQRTSLFVYDGEGAAQAGVAMAIQSLRRCTKNTPYSVSRITPQDIKMGKWRDSAALLVIGGGYDLGFISALGQEGIDQVKGYVQAGGHYLGVCAGAYFASARVTFDEGGDLEVCGPRQLAFFPGACIGPVFPGFLYNSDAGVHAACVEWSAMDPVVKHAADVTQRVESSDASTSGHTSRFHCYFNGGGCFVDASSSSSSSSSSSYKVLGRYGDVVSCPVAVVKCYVGQGVAVLSGVHLEYAPDLLNADSPHLQPLLPSLHRGDGDRQMCLRQILQMLGIQIVE